MSESTDPYAMTRTESFVADIVRTYAWWLNSCHKLNGLRRKLDNESDPVAREHIELAIIEADHLQQRLKSRLT